MPDPGGNDTNGVFLYGEDTPIGDGVSTSKFSDYLNRPLKTISAIFGRLKDHRVSATFIGTAVGTSNATLTSVTFAATPLDRRYKLAAILGVTNSNAAARSATLSMALSSPTGSGGSAALTEGYPGAQHVPANSLGTVLVASGEVLIPAGRGITVDLKLLASASSSLVTANQNGEFTAVAIG